MKRERYQQIRELFHAVCDLSPLERDQRLALECGDDGELRAEVEALLQSDVDQTDAFAEEQLGVGPRLAYQAVDRDPDGPSDASHHGRFLPGRVIADRYRIVSLLGRGGMGEVYRADDLKLGHPVALKFLPPAISQDSRRTEYFLNEVRLSRQIAHPNVCRVYDIDELNDCHFLSMEYVDGEDLGRLLRRIGRLPRDKGIDIARQLCLGVAAAHDRGILHRDLKPANIMVDGRGQVRITDFGIARLAQDGSEVGDIVGTPAYMAPEQVVRGETTVASDVYSLGLVLYELFTGEAIHSSKSMDDRRQPRADSSLRLPSTIIDDMDPGVERMVLACLADAPDERPKSALVVAAAFPGGGSLEAALAAGETPSPEVVAAAGTGRVFRRTTSMVLLFSILIGMLGIAVLSNRAQRLIGFQAESLLQVTAARRLIDSLGYGNRMTDSTWGLAWNANYFSLFQRDDEAREDWQRLTGSPPTAAKFWYRSHSRQLVPTRGHGPYAAVFVTPQDPSPLESGMIRLVFDGNGQLTEFLAPPTGDSHTPPAADLPWQGREQLLTAAGIDPASLELSVVSATERRPPPPVYADRWERSDAGTIAVEAAYYHGHPVYFRLGPDEGVPDRQSSSVWAAILAITILMVFATAIVLARRNWLAGRADRHGAIKLFWFVMVTSVLYWVFQAHHVMGSGELVMLLKTLSRALLRGVVICAAYVCLEPYVRRLWPQTLIGWNRVLRGDFTDNLVGRDVLAGIAAGVIAQLIASAGIVIGLPRQIALLADPVVSIGTGPFDLRPLLGLQAALGQICAGLFVGLVGGFVACPLLFFVLHACLRKIWLAWIAFVLFYSTPSLANGDSHGAITVALWTSLALTLYFRFGVLAVSVGWFTWQLLTWPVSFDNVVTNVDVGALAHLLIGTLAIYACWAASRIPGRHRLEVEPT